MNTVQTKRMTLSLSGLSYGGGGALLIERRLARTTGVVYAYVNAATEMAYIAYDCTRIDPQQLVTVVNQAGFRAGEPCIRSCHSIDKDTRIASARPQVRFKPTSDKEATRET